MASSMFLGLGALLIFAGVVVAFSIIGVLTSEKRAVGRSVAAVQALNSAPTELATEMDVSFADRVIAPFSERLVGIGRSMVRADTADKIRHRLDVAGNPPAWDVNRIIGTKVLGLAVVGSMGLLYMIARGGPITQTVLGTAVACAIGYVIPNILLKNAGDYREEVMRYVLRECF